MFRICSWFTDMNDWIYFFQAHGLLILMLTFIFFRVWRHACLDLFCPTWWREISWVHLYRIFPQFTDMIAQRFIFFSITGYKCLDLFFSGLRFTDMNAQIYFNQGMETCVLRFILSNMATRNYLSSLIPPFLFRLCLRFTDMNA